MMVAVSPQTTHDAMRPVAAASRISASASSSVRVGAVASTDVPPLHAAEHADDLAQDVDLRRGRTAPWRRVLGDSRTRPSTRSSRLTVASSPSTSAATISPSAAVLLAADDDVVAVEDAGVDHRLAADAEQEAVARRGEDARDGHLLLDVLLGEDRRAGRDATEQRQHPTPAHVAARRLPVAQVERARLGRVALQRAALTRGPAGARAPSTTR